MERFDCTGRPFTAGPAVPQDLDAHVRRAAQLHEEYQRELDIIAAAQRQQQQRQPASATLQAPSSWQATGGPDVQQQQHQQPPPLPPNVQPDEQGERLSWLLYALVQTLQSHASKICAEAKSSYVFSFVEALALHTTCC